MNFNTLKEVTEGRLYQQLQGTTFKKKEIIILKLKTTIKY